MTDLYPPESQRVDVIGHLTELRRCILKCLLVFSVASVLLLSQGTKILHWLNKPAADLTLDLIFLSPTEVFTSYLLVVLLAAFIVSFPFLLFQLGAFLTPGLTQTSRKIILGWLLLALVCFFGGISAAYGIFLPAGLHFLLNFGKGIAQPALSLSKYVSFSITLILFSGGIFEIPVILGLLTEAGLLDAKRLRANRRFAVIVIFILAAVITPTQDVINSLIFALPMIILYEIGIGLSALVTKRKHH